MTNRLPRQMAGQPDDPGVEPLRAPEAIDDASFTVIAGFCLGVGGAFLGVVWLVSYFR